MSRPLTDLAEKIAQVNHIQYELIGALGFLTFVLLTICIKMYVKGKRQDVDHLQKLMDEDRHKVRTIDMMVRKQEDKLHEYQNNVIRLESSIKKNSEKIKDLKDDACEARFETDAKLIEVTAKLDEVVSNLTSVIGALKDHTKI